MERDMPKLTLLEERKLQAAVLVPVLRAFRAELGEARANAIAREALYDWLLETMQRMLERSGIGPEAPPMQRFMAMGQAWADELAPETMTDFDTDTLRQDEAVWQFNVTGCRYAQFFRALGEPELGSMLVCSADTAMADTIEGLELVRTQTLMRGADHCDFLWRVTETPSA